MAIDWAEVEAALERGAIDDGVLDLDVADAVLCKDMLDRAIEGGPLVALEVDHSVYWKISARYTWPWQNPEALEILADEPGFDLKILLDNLPDL